MKIRSQKDIEVLDHKIKEELGIDVRKYKNEEVVENFVEIMVFPKYVINWVIRPILVAILIYIIGFFIFNLVHIEYVVYGIIGLLLFLAAGLLFGLLFLMWKMKLDMWGIINYSLEIMKSAVSDINQINSQINKENRKEVLGLLFKGIIHIVTIPMVSKIVADKVPKNILKLYIFNIKWTRKTFKFHIWCGSVSYKNCIYNYFYTLNIFSIPHKLKQDY